MRNTTESGDTDMIVKGVSRQDLAHSLRCANGRFSDNVYHVRCESLNRGDTRWIVVLGIHSKDGPGHKMTVARSWRKSHRQCNPCWHVYKQYLAALPHGTEVRSRCGLTVCDGYNTNWQDIDTGSMVNPIPESKRCECEA